MQAHASETFEINLSDAEWSRRLTDQQYAELRAMEQIDPITRHTCVEGWSAIGRWGDVRSSDFLRRVGADTSAKYVGFKCAGDYYTSIDMPAALHRQRLIALTYDGQKLPREYGFPMISFPAARRTAHSCLPTLPGVMP